MRPNEVLRKAFDLFSKLLVLRQLEVVWDLDPDLPEIMAETNRLEQVCINLLLNARDAIGTRRNGTGRAPAHHAGLEAAPKRYDDRVELNHRVEGNTEMLVTVNVIPARANLRPSTWRPNGRRWRRSTSGHLQRGGISQTNLHKFSN